MEDLSLQLINRMLTYSTSQIDQLRASWPITHTIDGRLVLTAVEYIRELCLYDAYMHTYSFLVLSPIEDLPMYINDIYPVSVKEVFKWRLKIGA
jgi:hypothetical protein